jgi:hypothetical protein
VGNISSAGNTVETPSGAVALRRAAIALLLALLVGLATFFFLGTGSGSTLAYAQEIIEVDNLDDYECDETEWHFVINQIDDPADAPEFITVTWSNGETEEVELEDVDGKVAHYYWYEYLDSTVVSATATIDIEGWSGNFNLSHGPCNEPEPSESPSGTPSTTPPSESPEPSESTSPSESHKPSESTSPSESHKPSESTSPSESESTVAVPTAVPAGADSGSGGLAAAGILGSLLVAGGALGTAMIVRRRRFLHES